MGGEGVLPKKGEDPDVRGGGGVTLATEDILDFGQDESIQLI